MVPISRAKHVRFEFLKAKDTGQIRPISRAKDFKWPISRAKDFEANSFRRNMGRWFSEESARREEKDGGGEGGGDQLTERWWPMPKLGYS